MLLFAIVLLQVLQTVGQSVVIAKRLTDDIGRMDYNIPGQFVRIDEHRLANHLSLTSRSLSLQIFAVNHRCIKKKL